MVIALARPSRDDLAPPARRNWTVALSVSGAMLAAALLLAHPVDGTNLFPHRDFHGAAIPPPVVTPEPVSIPAARAAPVAEPAVVEAPPAVVETPAPVPAAPRLVSALLTAPPPVLAAAAVPVNRLTPLIPPAEPAAATSADPAPSPRETLPLNAGLAPDPPAEEPEPGQPLVVIPYD